MKKKKVLVEILSVIWTQTWRVNVFGKSFDIKASLILDGTSLTLEIEADGQRAVIPIVEAETTLFTIFGFIDIKLKLSEIRFDGNTLKRLCLELRACARYLGCVTIASHCQNFRVLGRSEGVTVTLPVNSLIPVSE